MKRDNAQTSNRSLLALGAALAVCFLALLAGKALTTPNLGWYETLAKPGFAPPNVVFPLVWAVLYLMMAASAWLVWRVPTSEGDRKLALIWFAIQLVIGVAWSFAFFWLHGPFFGLVVIMVLLIAIVITIVLFDRSSRIASLLLVPYLLWVCFAAGLNFAIWYLNS
jgi:benzodiazapine receptor